MGRVRVLLRWHADDAKTFEAWARIATLAAGDEWGSWFIPEVDDEVLVIFEGGDQTSPYVVGSLWAQGDLGPEQMDAAGANHYSTFRSKRGLRVRFNDTDGEETLTLDTPRHQRIVLSDADDSIEIDAGGGSTIRLDQSGITINANSRVTVSTSTMEISAGMLTVNAGMSKFSGVVQVDTLIVVNQQKWDGSGPERINAMESRR
jgi:uncharacterized protein involved in type VI secretion and phage assembly